MDRALKSYHQSEKSVQPLCPVFNLCGGCLYQNIDYATELKIKEQQLKDLLQELVDISDDVFMNIVPSPKSYHYRNRLDMKLKRTRNNGIFIGFTPVDQKKGVIPVEACFIADEHISDFIPELKQQAIESLPKKYRNANLTIRCGDNKRVLWGGIGRQSCQLKEEDYFWTIIKDKKLFYSLDTFFQANLSILPKLIDVMRLLPVWNPMPILYDLYGGVGLFSISLSDVVQKSVLIEENLSSHQLARYNIAFNALDNIEVKNGKVESEFPKLLQNDRSANTVAVVDPPRAGLSTGACQILATAGELNHIFYLSCNPESLVRDLGVFIRSGWEIQTIVPFDFFPKTKHLETLVLLKKEGL